MSASNRLRPFAVNGWVDGILTLGSWVIFIAGVVLIARPALAGAGSVADYLPGGSTLLAGVFGLALAEVLSILHQLYRRLAEVETSVRERVAEAEARILARLPPAPESGGRAAPPTLPGP